MHAGVRVLAELLIWSCIDASLWNLGTGVPAVRRVAMATSLRSDYAGCHCQTHVHPSRRTRVATRMHARIPRAPIAIAL